MLIGVAALLGSFPALLISAPAAAAAEPQPDTWERLADMPVAGTSRVAVGGKGKDHRIYYVRPGAGVDVYDLDTQQWSTLPPSPLPQRCCSGVTVGKPDADGWALVYFVGSAVQYSYVAPLPIVEVYNPKTNSWSQLEARLQIPRGDAAAATDHQGRIYAIGGYGPVAGTSVERYDPANASAGWQAVASLPVARSQAKAMTGSDGRIGRRRRQRHHHGRL